MAMPLNTSSPKPAPGLPVIPRMDPDLLYQLNYMQGRGLCSTFILLPHEMPIVDIITAAKTFCGSRNWRFMHIEKAIHRLEDI